MNKKSPLMRYSFECLIRGLFGMFSTFFEFDSDVADAWKNLTLHVMLDGDVDGVAGSKAIGIDGKIVLVITDTLSLGSSTLVY